MAIGLVAGLASGLAAALLIFAVGERTAGADAPPSAVKSGGSPITVLAAGDLRGEIEPCGCSSEGQMGGLRRRLSYLEERLAGAAGGDTLLLDLGNNFPPPSPQGRLKIDLIQRLLKRYPPAALLPGPNELALGTDILDRELPYLISNDRVGRAFLREVTAERAGRRIVVLGFLSPGLLYQQSQSKFLLSPPDETLLRDWRSRLAAGKAELALLLFRGSDSELAAIHGADLFDLIISGNPSADELEQIVERNANGERLPQVPTKGQGVLRIVPAGGGNATQVDWLTDKFPDHPEAAPVFKAYNEEVKALFFSRMQQSAKQRDNSQFTGNEACKGCHQPQYSVWEASRHAGARKTLARVGKQFDPECLVCHVVGLGQGGYVNQDITPNLAGVQCENCHGHAKEHLAAPAQKEHGFMPPAAPETGNKPDQATCRTCHKGSHSPSFSYESYWPKIKH